MNLATVKRTHLAMMALGILFLLPGVVWLLGRGISQDDAEVACGPLARIPLDQLENLGSAAVVVTIPDSAQWKRIRHAWGDPDYLVAAVESPQSAQIIHCLDELGINIDVIVKSVHIPLKPALGRPYGYRGTCPQSGVEFRAAPGSDATIRVAAPRRHMPAGELVLMCYWKKGVKDKLAGIALEEELWTIARITTGIGAGAGFLRNLSLALPALYTHTARREEMRRWNGLAPAAAVTIAVRRESERRKRGRGERSDRW